METPFFDNLIDDFGIWQHTDGADILFDEGYALDDAARGLVVCLALGRTKQAEVLFSYIEKSRHQNRFYGFATKNRRFVKFPSSDDATGQAIWAMGYAYSLGFNKDMASKLITDLKPTITNFKHMRGDAYALLGALYIDKKLATQLADKIIDKFSPLSKDWLWPELTITYAVGIMPYALLRYSIVYKNKTAGELGLNVLMFLQSICEKGRPLGPIGNDGWYTKKTKVAPNYSQQPIDSAYMAWAWLAAYELYKDNRCLAIADEWYDWFDGKNIKSEMMYDPKTLECFDGIDEAGVHYHSGAESNICFLLTKYLLSL